jgi:hypothetical protein
MTESGLFGMPMGFEKTKRPIGMDLTRFPDREDRPAIKVPTQNKPVPHVPDENVSQPSENSYYLYSSDKSSKNEN